MRKVISKSNVPNTKGTVFEDEHLTEQSHKDLCDINFLVRQYTHQQLVEHAENHKGRYDDFTQVDFQNAQIVIAESKSMFEALPAEIRKEFNHDPGEFLGFCQNPDNLDKMTQMGIAKGVDGVGFDINQAMTYSKHLANPVIADPALDPNFNSDPVPDPTSDSASATPTE